MSRFFFALWPDQVTRKAIVNCHSQLSLSGRLTAPSKLHLTLLFLGKLNVNQQQKIIQHAEQIHCPEFEMCLTHTDYFKKSKVVWLGLTSTPAVLSDLHNKLLSAAEKCQLAALATKTDTFTPHVTLARRSVFPGTQQVTAITWHVKSFVLVESIDTASGVKYQIIKNFSKHSLL